MLNSPEIVGKLRPLSTTNLESIGDVLQYAIPWAGLLAIALRGDSTAAREWLIAGVLTVVLTHVLKYLFNFSLWGKRPDGGSFAFPSGHTSSAFMGAVFIVCHLGWLWGAASLIFAAVTAYSRVWAHRHWWRDVIAGALLGSVITFVVAGYI